MLVSSGIPVHFIFKEGERKKGRGNTEKGGEEEIQRREGRREYREGRGGGNTEKGGEEGIQRREGRREYREGRRAGKEKNVSVTECSSLTLQEHPMAPMVGHPP